MDEWDKWTSKTIAELTPREFADLVGIVALLAFLLVLLGLWAR